MRKLLIPFAMCFLIGIPVSASVSGISISSMPPVVLKTVPQAGDNSVDPSLNEIKVTFSKDMLTQENWSWVIVSKDSFPKITGKVHYLKDKRTCVAPVKLEAGKTYGIWFNSGKYNYFKDTQGNSAVPYLLVFKTRK